MIPQTIKLEMKPDTLTEIVRALDFEIPQKKDRKMSHYISLLAHVTLKLAKKEVANRGAEKPLKLKLEYFEANTLYETLKVVLIRQPDRDIQNVKDQLDQKLS